MTNNQRSPQRIADLLSVEEAQKLNLWLRNELISGASSLAQLANDLVTPQVELYVPDDWEQRLKQLPVREEGVHGKEKTTLLDFANDYLADIAQQLNAEMEAWASATTDFDRLYCSILEMRAKGVEVLVFDDWGSSESDGDELGEALIPFEMADGIDFQEVSIDFYVRSMTEQVTEAVQVIIDSLKCHGLHPVWDSTAKRLTTGPISVRMVWQPHSILEEGWDDLFETPEEYLASLAVPPSES